MIAAIYPKIRRLVASFRSVTEARGGRYPRRRIFYDNSGAKIRVGKESEEGGRRIRVRQTIDSRWAEIVLAGTGGGAAKVGGAEGKRALAYQLPGCARLPGGARMIYSVIEHPCRCGRNSMATPTVWNVRAAPAASAAATTTTTAAATGMFMLLPLCLYLVAVLPLHCSSSTVPATDAAVVAAVAATDYHCRSPLASRPSCSAPISDLSGSFHLAFIIAKHFCQLKLHRFTASPAPVVLRRPTILSSCKNFTST